MRILERRGRSVFLLLLLTGLAIAFLPACSVNVKGHNGEKGKVEISTPIGGIHVDENADARDAGLPVYPGAKLKPKTDEEGKSANVDISTFGFGLKVVALEYESGDPPDKVIAYYQEQLKKYGGVLQCHSHGFHQYSHGGFDLHEKGSKQLKCDDDNTGSTVELKAGNEDNEHIVSVDPQGKGSDFDIVWVRIRGKEGEDEI